ncbi:serine/arginine-rich splicing factor 4/5/6 [Nematocida sp. AWRm80]|nr:serine/arginine-rich splicing factor 4/5/6 [Nematocida sp. AWRm80]
MQLYIGGVKETAKEKEIYEYFLKFGAIDGIKLYKSYGFITSDKEVGEKILKEATHEVDGQSLVVEVAKGTPHMRRMHSSLPLYGNAAQKGQRKLFRLIMEKLPKNIDWSELRSFVLTSGVRPVGIKLLKSGDSLLEFSSRQERDWAISKLNSQVLYGQAVSARLGRKRTEIDELKQDEVQ